jgi:ATP-dependent RNA circularization protein (DNA/RNA ligase family)
MTPEEMERAIEFLLDHHAKFAAELQQSREDMQIIRETQREFQSQLGKLGEAVIALTGMVGRIAEAQIRTDTRVAELAEAQFKTDEQVTEIAGRLNDFIVVVERYISEGRNGRKS